MNQRYVLGILALLAFGFIVQSTKITNFISNNPIHPTEIKLISQDSSAINLTWTSRWESIPQQVENYSLLAGDHIVLNATFFGLEEFSMIKMTFMDTNITISNTSRSVVYDTYYLIGNSSEDIRISVFDATNVTISQVLYLDTAFGNWFSPLVTVNYPNEIEEDLFNLTWFSVDQNDDDANFYQVWLSADDGVSYQLLANNLTGTFYLWDSTGFIHDNFRIRIRAFSVDLSVYSGPFIEIPDDYWPGDFGDGFVDFISRNGIPHPAFITITNPSDFSFYYGELGKSITWNLGFSSSGIMPSQLSYTISHNGTHYKVDTMQITGRENQLISLPLDQFSVGTHIFTLELSYVLVTNSLPATVVVEILPLPEPIATLGILVFFGLGGTIGVIFLSIILYERQRQIRE